MLISPAYAQTAASPAGGLFGPNVLQFAPLVLIFAVFYFLVIRPQQAQQKKLRQAIAAMKRGDRVVVSGILGQVAKVGEATAEIEIAPGVKIEVQRESITSVVASGKGKDKDGAAKEK
ncbi:MAG: preprotein translocase subunit YajC [Rhodospirillales bacterium]|nr:preprotein translocase subunit YajC [Rhodospirillales bacterium]